MFIHSNSSLETQFPKRGKVYTRFQTKTAQKPYPMGQHIPVSPIWGSTPPPRLKTLFCLKGHPVPDNNKKPLRAVFSLTCLKIRLRNEEAINSTWNKTDLLAKCFLLPILSTSILFTCFWFDLVRVLATTGNTSAVEIDSLFQTKMAKKPYPLAWHIPRYSL